MLIRTLKTYLKSISLVFLGLLGFVSPSHVYGEDTQLIAMARTAGSVAGAARFCEVEDDLIEEYIAKTEAKLAVRAQDEYEKVLARLEFRNILVAASAKAPNEGCRTFISAFETTVRQLR